MVDSVEQSIAFKMEVGCDTINEFVAEGESAPASPRLPLNQNSDNVGGGTTPSVLAMDMPSGANSGGASSPMRVPSPPQSVVIARGVVERGGGGGGGGMMMMSGERGGGLDELPSPVLLRLGSRMTMSPPHSPGSHRPSVSPLPRTSSMRLSRPSSFRTTQHSVQTVDTHAFEASEGAYDSDAFRRQFSFEYNAPTLQHLQQQLQQQSPQYQQQQQQQQRQIPNGRQNEQQQTVLFQQRIKNVEEDPRQNNNDQQQQQQKQQYHQQQPIIKTTRSLKKKKLGFFKRLWKLTCCGGNVSSIVVPVDKEGRMVVAPQHMLQPEQLPQRILYDQNGNLINPDGSLVLPDGSRSFHETQQAQEQQQDDQKQEQEQQAQPQQSQPLPQQPQQTTSPRKSQGDVITPTGYEILSPSVANAGTTAGAYVGTATVNVSMNNNPSISPLNNGSNNNNNNNSSMSSRKPPQQQQQQQQNVRANGVSVDVVSVKPLPEHMLPPSTPRPRVNLANGNLAGGVVVAAKLSAMGANDGGRMEQEMTPQQYQLYQLQLQQHQLQIQQQQQQQQRELEEWMSRFNLFYQDDYIIIRQLYKSYASHVHLATQKADNQNVVLKFLKANTKIQHEIKALKKVQGIPGTVQLLEILRTDSEIILSMAEVKARSRHFCPDSALSLKKYMRQLLEVLATVHDLGIIHRDIKESNALMADRVVVIDFGLAVIGETCAGVAGTKGYIAPELHIRHGIGTNKIDIFSSGVVFTQMLFGIHFRGLKDVQAITMCDSKDACIAYCRQRFVGWEKMDRVNIIFEIGIWQLIRRMLSFDPHERPSCKEALTYTCLQNLDAEEALKKKKSVSSMISNDTLINC